MKIAIAAAGSMGSRFGFMLDKVGKHYPSMHQDLIKNNRLLEKGLAQ